MIDLNAVSVLHPYGQRIGKQAMAQSLSEIYVHIIFSTKHRKPFLQHDVQNNLHAYLSGICKNLGCPALQTGGVADHVHLICRLGKEATLVLLLRELKRDSSKWIKENYAKLGAFQWQQGYGAFSVSPTQLSRVVEYVKNQDEHHREVSFQEEFRRICAKNGIELDERYAWE